VGIVEIAAVHEPPLIQCGEEKAAADDQRSLSSLFEKLLTDHLRTKGYIPDKPRGKAKR